MSLSPDLIEIIDFSLLCVPLRRIKNKRKKESEAYECCYDYDKPSNIIAYGNHKLTHKSVKYITDDDDVDDNK